MSPQSRSDIAGLLDSAGVSPARRLGQHFLADANITNKIVGVSGVGPGDLVVEVGAGTGTLTHALAAVGARVVAYEVDERLRPILDSVLAGMDVDLRFEDIAGVDLEDALDGGPWTMVANLPYNVGTRVVLDAMRFAQSVRRFVVMVQREVAYRLVARPGGKDYGLPSVVAGIHTRAVVAFDVPPQVFYPRPRVDSSVVVMAREKTPPGAERAIELARAAFGQRRKMLRGSLAPVLGHVAATLAEAGIDQTARAEDLSPGDYLRLAGLG